MSRDFHAYLEHYNEDTHKWDSVMLYHFNPDVNKNDCYIESPFLLGGWGDFADILCDNDHCNYERLNGRIIHYEDLDSYSDLVADVLKNHVFSEETHGLDVGYFGLRCINAADIKIYTLEHPLVKDYDVEWPQEAFDDPLKIPMTDNPLTWIVARIRDYAELSGIYCYYESLSNFRLIVYGDC